MDELLAEGGHEEAKKGLVSGENTTEQQQQPDDTQQEPTGSTDTDRKTLIEIVGFLSLAIVTYILYTTIITSAEDILASTHIPTSSTIICLNTPYFIMTLVMPYYVDKVPLITKAIVSSMFFAIALVLIALITTPGLRLIGILVASLGLGTAEIGFLSATSLHQDLTMHAFATGTGLGAILGPAIYTIMTTFVCVHPSTVLLLLLLFLPLFPAISWYVAKNTTYLRPSGQDDRPVEYMRIGEDQSAAEMRHQNLTREEKINAAKANMHLAVPLFFGLFADYLTMQGVVTTIAFEDSPFDPRDHYQYYTISFWIGELLGRSYGLILSWGKPDWTVVTHKTWIFTAILLVNVFFLILSSLYRFLPSYVIVMMLTFVTGSAEGALYLNSFAMAGRNMSPRYKEFSRAFLTTAVQGGVLVAGLTGLWVEPALKDHCSDMIANTDYCFTRSMHGWNVSTSCIT